VQPAKKKANANVLTQLEQSLHRALALANERHTNTPPWSTLLLALVDDQDRRHPPR